MTPSCLLNTALPMPEARPLCQKPPSPITEIDALVGLDVEGRGRGRPEAVAHRRRADVEGRQDREQVAADIGRDVVLAELLLDQLHRREDRPLRAAGAEAGRTRRHDLGQRLDLRVVQHRRGVRDRRPVAEQRPRMGLEEGSKPLTSTGAVYSPPIGSTSLPATLGLDVAAAQDRVERLLDIFGRALLDHQHRVLADGRTRRPRRRSADRRR